MSIEDAGWFGRSQENTPSLRARIAALEAEVARLTHDVERHIAIAGECEDRAEAAEARAKALEDALRELVRLKDYKDKAGADASYYAQKIRAWDAPRAALRQEETP